MEGFKIIILTLGLFISSGAYAQSETSMKGSFQLTIGYTDSLNQFISLNKGAAILLSTDDGPSDTISIVQIQDGNVSFNEIEPGSIWQLFILKKFIAHLMARRYFSYLLFYRGL